MGDHHVDGSAYFGSAGTQRRIGARRDVRPQTAALLDMLAVLQSTLSQANRAGDLIGAREAVAGRVACWVALADLADEVHPAYAMACRRLAWIEGESLPPAQSHDRSVPARGAFAGRTAIARQMALEGRHAAADRASVSSRHRHVTRTVVPATEASAPRHLAPGRAGTDRLVAAGSAGTERLVAAGPAGTERLVAAGLTGTGGVGAREGRHSAERAAVRRLAIARGPAAGHRAEQDPTGVAGSGREAVAPVSRAGFAVGEVRPEVPDPRSPVRDGRAGVPDGRSPAARPAGWHPVPRPRRPEDQPSSGFTRAAG